ncbi:IPP transferase-domain-containing protein [Limtongia smithiae]|uniref:IPP transferase-domain-containing protein n=1 Tax=Limtongia smithiae TaxID=1125753 RepID=UPI0034CD2A68
MPPSPRCKTSLISIIGTTGVGKSKLSISLCRALNGEVINGDSMQVYRGLDTMTNKHPLVERMGIEHHLLGHITDRSAQYTVKQFESEATFAVADITNRGKCPVVVGGTHYYIQSFLFDGMTVGGSEDSQFEKRLTEEDKEFIKAAETRDLFDRLKFLDPVLAEKFHPRDRRKITTALSICMATGRRASDIYSEQRQQKQINDNARYRTLIFWLYCAPDVLDVRLDKRVDDMVKHGDLLSEVKEMSDLYESIDPAPSTEMGIWQVIGFKEFLSYIHSKDAIDRNSGLEEMKRATRKYADTQVRWIRKKLLDAVAEAPESVTLVLLDATDLEKWDDAVDAPAIAIARDFLRGTSPLTTDRRAPAGLAHLIEPVAASTNRLKQNPAEWKHYECAMCANDDGESFVCIGEASWKAHVQGRRHRQKLKRMRERETYERWKATQTEKADHEEGIFRDVHR